MAVSVHLLQPEVAAKYECTVTPCQLILPWLGGRTVDLRTLTLAEADELVTHPRFTYLVPRQQKRKRAAKTST